MALSVGTLNAGINATMLAVHVVLVLLAEHVYVLVSRMQLHRHGATAATDVSHLHLSHWAGVGLRRLWRRRGRRSGKTGRGGGVAPDALDGTGSAKGDAESPAVVVAAADDGWATAAADGAPASADPSPPGPCACPPPPLDPPPLPTAVTTRAQHLSAAWIVALTAALVALIPAELLLETGLEARRDCTPSPTTVVDGVCAAPWDNEADVPVSTAAVLTARLDWVDAAWAAVPEGASKRMNPAEVRSADALNAQRDWGGAGGGGTAFGNLVLTSTFLFWEAPAAAARRSAAPDGGRYRIAAGGVEVVLGATDTRRLLAAYRSRSTDPLTFPVTPAANGRVYALDCATDGLTGRDLAHALSLYRGMQLGSPGVLTFTPEAEVQALPPPLTIDEALRAVFALKADDFRSTCGGAVPVYTACGAMDWGKAVPLVGVASLLVAAWLAAAVAGGGVPRTVRVPTDAAAWRALAVGGGEGGGAPPRRRRRQRRWRRRRQGGWRLPRVGRPQRVARVDVRGERRGRGVAAAARGAAPATAGGGRRGRHGRPAGSARRLTAVAARQQRRRRRRGGRRPLVVATRARGAGAARDAARHGVCGARLTRGRGHGGRRAGGPCGRASCSLLCYLLLLLLTA
ncbi:hypothetical protein BU14_0431s0010 [Porphyra umbilicalis]|uniref:Uncharacterized protein n=1 Tax=Porphyra umbilicalis TaxID=2786 RepID=A0A1X6NVF2_PORUM|nr:hypothetical protein BU14_0431s0010 [Porphyra umbilicalis]|eukprot:OSX72486.1 hypothetical protein BU14_0431s0010 [Porphyra umbilicalis]